MTLFFVIAAVLALVAAALAVMPLVVGRGRVASRAARDAQVFRDQLEELDRDVARGAVSQAEAEGARAEISRRLIAAASEAERVRDIGPAPERLSGLATGAAFVAVPAIAAVVYFSTGAPGMPDLPFAARDQGVMAGAVNPARPSQAEAEQRAQGRNPDLPAPTTPEEQEYADLIQRLEGIVAERPEDIRGRRLLANGYMRLQRFADARVVFEELIDLLGPRADATVFAQTAEAMVLATGGYVSPKAERMIDRALALDAALPKARYYDGLRLAQTGRLAAAIDVWERLQAEAPEDAAFMPWLGDMLAEARRMQAGRPASAAAPGPDAATMEAARDMSPEERQAMIEGMVGRLETRLTESGGSPEEWFRLINAYAVLGRMEEARRVYAMSQEALDGSEAGFVREQALVLGVAEE